jgi:hypothetical protein
MGNYSYLSDFMKKQQKPTNEYDKGQYWSAPEPKQVNYGYLNDFMQKTQNIDRYATGHQQIQQTTDNLNESGVPIPKPDVAKQGGRSFLEKYIFDPLSSLQYGVANATKNMVDDDASNNAPLDAFWKGFSSGFGGNQANYRTSFQDVLKTLVESKSVYKRGIGFSISEANQWNMINNRLHPEEAKARIKGVALGDEEAIRQQSARTVISGLGLDIVADPLNPLNDVVSGLKVVAKGDKAVNVAKAVGAVDNADALDKAMDVLKRAGKITDATDPKEAEKLAKYLIDKTAKLGGAMPDFKGIKYGEKVIVKPETLAKIGEKLPLKDIDLSNKYTETFKHLFSYGKNAPLIKGIMSDPANAMERVAYMNTAQELISKKFGKVSEAFKNAKDKVEAKLGKGENDIIRNALETPDEVTYHLKSVMKEVPNEDRAIQLNRARVGMLHGEIEDLKKSMAELKDIVDNGANGSARNRAKAKLIQLTNLKSELESLPELEGLGYMTVVSNEKLGIDLSKFNMNDEGVARLFSNPVESSSRSLKEMYDYLHDLKLSGALNASDSELEELAIRLKSAADITVENIKKYNPSLAKYYAGNTTLDVKDFLKTGSTDDVDVADLDKRYTELLQQKRELINEMMNNPETYSDNRMKAVDDEIKRIKESKSSKRNISDKDLQIKEKLKIDLDKYNSNNKMNEYLSKEMPTEEVEIPVEKAPLTEEERKANIEALKEEQKNSIYNKVEQQNIKEQEKVQSELKRIKRAGNPKVTLLNGSEAPIDSFLSTAHDFLKKNGFDVEDFKVDDLNMLQKLGLKQKYETMYRKLRGVDAPAYARISEKQANYIKGLYKDCGYVLNDEAISAIEKLPRADAGTLIDDLSDIKQNRVSARMKNPFDSNGRLVDDSAKLNGANAENTAENVSMTGARRDLWTADQYRGIDPATGKFVGQNEGTFGDLRYATDDESVERVSKLVEIMKDAGVDTSSVDFEDVLERVNTGDLTEREFKDAVKNIYELYNQVIESKPSKELVSAIDTLKKGILQRYNLKNPNAVLGVYANVTKDMKLNPITAKKYYDDIVKLDNYLKQKPSEGQIKRAKALVMQLQTAYGKEFAQRAWNDMKKHPLDNMARYKDFTATAESWIKKKKIDSGKKAIDVITNKNLLDDITANDPEFVKNLKPLDKSENTVNDAMRNGTLVAKVDYFDEEPGYINIRTQEQLDNLYDKSYDAEDNMPYYDIKLYASDSAYTLNADGKKVIPNGSKNSYILSKPKQDMMTFKTPYGNFAFGTDVPPEQADKIVKAVQESPEELQRLLRNKTIVTIDGEKYTKVGDQIKQAAASTYDKTILNYSNDATGKMLPEQTAKTMRHEAGHVLDNTGKGDIANVTQTLSSELKNLPEESKTELAELLKRANVSVEDDAVSMIRGGSISKYSKAVSGADAEKGGKETFADLTSVIMHPDKSISGRFKELTPETTAAYYDYLKSVPKGRLRDVLPEHITASEELTKRIERLKSIVDTVDPKDSNTIAEYENKLRKLTTALNDDDEMVKYIDDKFGGLFSKQFPRTKQWTNVYEKITKSAGDSLPQNIKEVFDFLRSEFKEFAKTEGVDELEKYLMHSLNPELKHSKKMRGAYEEMVRPLNMHTLKRKYGGTIDEINRVMEGVFEENGIKGVKNFFDTNVARIYFARAMHHEDFMFKKGMLDNTLDLFGMKVDADSVEKLFTTEKEIASKRYGIPMDSKHWKTEYYKNVKEKLNSGNYVIVAPDKKYTPVNLKVVDNESISKGVTERNKSRVALRSLKKDDDRVLDALKRLENPEIEKLYNTEINSPLIKINMKDISEKEFYKLEGATYIIPKDVYETYVKATSQQYNKTKNAFIIAFDKFMQLFKIHATSLNAPFHVTNAMGNYFNTYLNIGVRALDPHLNAKAAQLQAYYKTGKLDGSFAGKTFKEIEEKAKKLGVLSHDFFGSDVKGFMQWETETLGDKNAFDLLKKRLNPLSQEFFAYRGGRKIGSAIEDHGRLVNFLAALEDGKTYEEAADITNKFLFDYSDLTEFEQNVMKRIVPFYTFARKNIPLQWERLLNDPQKFRYAMLAQKAVNKPETEEQKRYKPDYLENAIHLGNGKYLNLNLPMNDLQKLFDPKELYGMINPLKSVAEAGFNKNPYFNAPISRYEGDVTKTPSYAKLIPGLTEETPNGTMMNPEIRHILRNLLPFVENISNAVDVNSGDATQAQQDKVNSWTSGIRKYTVDVDKAKEQALYDYIQKLKDLEQVSKKKGVLKKEEEQTGSGYKYLNQFLK